jgi:pyruvate/2-oxoglutarate dehydrogenase complex dihydrolipoamide acyltransferase (E2) component
MPVDKAWVVDGKIEIRKIMTIVFTCDHRVADGALVVKPMKTLQKLLENPALMEKIEFDGNQCLTPDLLENKKDK